MFVSYLSGRASSGGALVPQPPHATRSQPESLQIVLVTFFSLEISQEWQETAQLSVCAYQVRGSILRNFCRLVAYLCRVVSLRQ